MKSHFQPTDKIPRSFQGILQLSRAHLQLVNFVMQHHASMSIHLIYDWHKYHEREQRAH